MKLVKPIGAASEIWQVFIADSSSTTGAGLTGLAFNSGSLTAYYHRDTDTTATAITLATMTVGTFASGGFKEVDAANMPGVYQFCPPNAALASGAKSCAFLLKGATNMAPLPIEVQLTAGFSFDTATPDVNASKVGGTSQTGRDLGASVLLSPGTGTGQVSLSSGAVLLQATQTGVTIPTVTTLTNAPSDSSGVTTLLTRLSAARAGYLDNLSAGAVALEASLQVLITTIGASAAGVATAVWANATRLLTAGTNIVLAKGTGVTGLNDLSAAQVNAEADTAISDAALASAANLAIVAGYLDTEIAAIKAKTDNLPASPAATSDIPSAATIASAAAAQVTSDHGAGSYARNTEPLDAAGVRTALGLGSANLDTQIGDLPTNSELATALAAADDAVLAAIGALSIPTASANASAMLAAAYEGSETFQQFLRLARAALAGKANGFGADGATAGHFRSAADDKNRLTVVTDEFGNRTTVTTDVS